MITDSLPDTTFDAMLDVAAGLQMDMLEFACGNWSIEHEDPGMSAVEGVTRSVRLLRSVLGRPALAA